MVSLFCGTLLSIDPLKRVTEKCWRMISVVTRGNEVAWFEQNIRGGLAVMPPANSPQLPISLSPCLRVLPSPRLHQGIIR